MSDIIYYNFYFCSITEVWFVCMYVVTEGQEFNTQDYIKRSVY